MHRIETEPPWTQDDGSPAARDLCGQVLDGKYELVRKVAEGAMGEIYEARHARLGRRFAVKVIHAELLTSQRAIQRFAREMLAVSRIESDYIVPALDCGFTSDRTPYYVMEFVRGADLREILRAEGPLSVRRAVRLAIDVCRGLEILHANGLVHRDLKPANVFISRDDEGRERARVLDLGLVQIDASGSTSRSGTLVGTARYMAPEQACAEGRVDQRADIYALGAILFECLTGEPPHAGATLEEVLFRIVNDPTPSLRQHRPGVSLALDETVRRALARDPGHRHASAAELTAELRLHVSNASERQQSAALLEETLAESQSELERLGSRARPSAERIKLRRWAAGISLLLGGLVAVAFSAPGIVGLGRDRSNAAVAARTLRPSEPRASLALAEGDRALSLVSSVTAAATSASARSKAVPEASRPRPHYRSRTAGAATIQVQPPAPAPKPDAVVTPLMIDPTNPYTSSQSRVAE